MTPIPTSKAGGFKSPSASFMGGSMPPGAPGLPGAAPDPDQDGDDDSSQAPSPAALHYHADPQSCSSCRHLKGQNCEVLQMPVSPEGGCAAFEAGNGGDDSQGDDAGDDNDTGVTDDGAAGGY